VTPNDKRHQGLNPFEFIGISSGTGFPKIKQQLWFCSGFWIKKKMKVSVPNNFATGSR